MRISKGTPLKIGLFQTLVQNSDHESIIWMLIPRTNSWHTARLARRRQLCHLSQPLTESGADEAQREEVSTCFYCKDGVLGECHGDRRCYNWASPGIIEGVQLWLNHDIRQIDGGGQRRTSPQLAAGKQSYKLSFLAFHGGITQSYYIIDLDSAPPLSFRSKPCWIVTLWFFQTPSAGGQCVCALG